MNIYVISSIHYDSYINKKQYLNKIKLMQLKNAYIFYKHILKLLALFLKKCI